MIIHSIPDKLWVFNKKRNKNFNYFMLSLIYCYYSIILTSATLAIETNTKTSMDRFELTVQPMHISEFIPHGTIEEEDEYFDDDELDEYDISSNNKTGESIQKKNKLFKLVHCVISPLL